MVGRFIRVLGTAAWLGGCGLFSDKPPTRPCPPVAILDDAGRTTQFKAGPGRDLTDVLAEGEIIDLFGSCKYLADSVDIDLVVAIAAERGPADKTGNARFDYFVAVPRLHPRPEGKRIFTVDFEFKGNISRLIYSDRINIRLPIDPKERSAPNRVYVGFQLTPEQIDYNRRSLRR